MTFDKNKVYTALNADEVKVGSTGCFGNSIAELKENVEDREIYKLTDILSSEEDYRFEMRIIKNLHFRFFYLIAEPQQEKGILRKNKMMELNKIYNEKCSKTLKRLISEGQKIDLILTSPPYNTGRPSNSERSLSEHEGRYDVHLDNMTS
jgi:hypothetical protein